MNIEIKIQNDNKFNHTQTEQTTLAAISQLLQCSAQLLLSYMSVGCDTIKHAKYRC